MTAGSTLPEDGVGTAAVLEVQRFEWVTPQRIEIAGVWSGLRARRFIRPTLVLEGAGESKRLLATLEHKPWAAEDGEDWVAAFAWEGPVVKFESADLNVGAGLDLRLPAPRMRPGKPRRFPYRAVSGVPTEQLPAPAPEPEPERDEPESRDDAHGAIEALRVKLDEARTERDTARSERDAALDQLRQLRSDMEAERQRLERAIADARAEERASATTMLAQGAELRTSVERQRELAYAARDGALKAQEAAIEARDRAIQGQEQAIEARKQADRDRDRAISERQRAEKERDRAKAIRDEALAARDRALKERDEATQERDTIVSLHERGLPVKQPKPRFLSEPPAHASQMDLWLPRATAIGILVIFAVIVLRLFTGG